MKLTVLGCYAATPRTISNPTSQVIEFGKHLFLIDCGEGTQIQLRKLKLRFSKINHIFISHLHGDHFFGLPGLVATFRLLGRKTPLHVYGPKGVKEAVSLLLKLGDSWTNYPLYFHELTSNESELVFEDSKVTVHTIPLDHRVYTNGFLFREKTHPRRIDKNKIENYPLDKYTYQQLKDGKDVETRDGRMIPNKELTLDPKPSQSYAFCSDTAYCESIVDLIHKVDVLYHESTFLSSELELAQKTKHSTALQAATIAAKAKVDTLLLGHYSTRYGDLNSFLEEANQVFENVLLADDGMQFEF